MKLIEKTNYHIDVKQLQDDFDKIVEKHPEFYKHHVFNVSYHPDMPNPYYDIPGYVDSEYFYLDDGSFRSFKPSSEPKSDTEITEFELGENFKFKESEVTHLNDVFVGTSFEKLYSDLRTKFNVTFMKVVLAKPGFVYTIHRDMSKLRYLMALRTHKHCFFAYPEEEIIAHIPEDGYLYKLDTSKMHTAVNPTPDFQRLHIICSTAY